MRASSGNSPWRATVTEAEASVRRVVRVSTRVHHLNWPKDRLTFFTVSPEAPYRDDVPGVESSGRFLPIGLGKPPLIPARGHIEGLPKGYWQCPIPECGGRTKKLKDHVFRFHVPSVFRERDQPWDSDEVQQALDALHRWIMGGSSRDSAHDLLGYFLKHGQVFVPALSKIGERYPTAGTAVPGYGLEADSFAFRPSARKLASCPIALEGSAHPLGIPFTGAAG